eukprot:gene1132-488_t
MVEKLKTYPNPVSGPARLISSGIELQPVTVEGLLQARSIGEEMHNAFYSDRLISCNVDFFEPVKKSGIKTGLEKKKKTGKVLSVLKEDRQALGIIVEKCHNKRDAFSHCLTTYPLAIATTDGKLYQPGSKAKFRNYIIEEADASIMSPPLQATWIYDAMATIRASKPAKTWGDYMANQLRSFTPASPLNAAESLGTARTLDAEDQHDVTSFIKNVIYNGKSDEDLVSLRIRQYDRLRLKTTQTIIPDPGSIAYAVKRANMAAYYLKHFGTRIVQKINPCDSGWYCKDGVLNPRWYDGPQMPPSATARQNRPRSQHTTDVETSGSDAEREELNNDFDAHDDNASKVEFWEQLFEDFSSESDEYDSDDPEYIP